MYFRAKLGSLADKVKYIQLSAPEERREEKLEYIGAAAIIGKTIRITALYPSANHFHLRIWNGIAGYG